MVIVFKRVTGSITELDIRVEIACRSVDRNRDDVSGENFELPVILIGCRREAADPPRYEKPGSDGIFWQWKRERGRGGNRVVAFNFSDDNRDCRFIQLLDEVLGVG